MNIKFCRILIVLSVAITGIIATQSSEHDAIEHTILRGRFADTIYELEWLLHQLVDILSDMVDGIAQEPSLMQNENFRQILIQVIRRIDIILHHFETVGESVLTPSVQIELRRIECIRIRLWNYLKPSKPLDDSKCRANTTATPSKPIYMDMILPLLMQIVSLLTKVTKELEQIKQLIPVSNNNNNNNINGGMTPSVTTAAPMDTTIDWNQLITDFIESKPSQDTFYTTEPTISNMITTTTTPTTVAIVSPETTTKSWQDALNDMINNWDQQLTTQSPQPPVNIDECVNAILNLINSMQNQLKTAPIF